MKLASQMYVLVTSENVQLFMSYGHAPQKISILKVEQQLLNQHSSNRAKTFFFFIWKQKLCIVKSH